MGVYDLAARDQFAAEVQPQNFARLLLRVVQHVYDLLNNDVLNRSTSEPWKVTEGSTVSHPYLRSSPKSRVTVQSKSDRPALAVGTVTTSTERPLDRVDIRLCFWQIVRECREVILKVLVLIQLVEQPGFQANIDAAIELTSRLLNSRGAIRKRCQDFAYIQWPPIGISPPPTVLYPVDVAMEVLFGGGTYPRLPLMMEETVKQLGLSDPAMAITLDKNDRQTLQGRIEDEVVGLWGMSECPKQGVYIRVCNGKILFHLPHEFSVTAIYDLTRCQILEARLHVGEVCGLSVPPLLHIGFRNVLRQHVGLAEARYRFAIDALTRSLRQQWRRMSRLEIERRQTLFSDDSVDTCDTKTSANDQVISANTDRVASLAIARIKRPIEEVEKDMEENRRDIAALENALRHAAVLEEKTSFVEVVPFLDETSYTISCKTEQSGTHVSSSTSTEFAVMGVPHGRVDPPDYFAEIFKAGKRVCANMMLAFLKDQVLRAKNFPSRFPGGVFRFIEKGGGKSQQQYQRHPRSQLEEVPANSIKTQEHPSESVLTTANSLDVYFFSRYDFTCGHLLYPIYAYVFQHPVYGAHSVTAYCQDMLLSSSDYAEATDSAILPTQERPAESTLPRLLTEDTKLPRISRRHIMTGSGSVLRFSFDHDKAAWTTTLWPFTLIEWFLRSVECGTAVATGCFEKNDTGSQTTECKAFDIWMEQHVTHHRLDLDALYAAIKNDPSWDFIRQFEACRLELSLWTSHAAACLSTLLLATLYAYVRTPQQGVANVFTSNLRLQCGDRRRQGSNAKMASWMNASYRRSLKIVYFDQYVIHLQLNSFNGSLQVMFRREVFSRLSEVNKQQLVQTAPSWIRIPGRSNISDSTLETSLTKVIAARASGPSTFIRALPYIKFMAFLDMLIQEFGAFGYSETNASGFEDAGDIDGVAGFSTGDEDTTNAYQPNSFRGVLPHGSPKDNSLGVSGLVYLPPSEIADDAQIFYTLDRYIKRVLQDGNECLEATLTLTVPHSRQFCPITALNEGHQEFFGADTAEDGSLETRHLKAFLRITVRNTLTISETHVAVVRMDGTSSKVVSRVAQLRVPHAPLELRESELFSVASVSNLKESPLLLWRQELETHLKNIQQELVALTPQLQYAFSIGRIAEEDCLIELRQISALTPTTPALESNEQQGLQSVCSLSPHFQQHVRFLLQGLNEDPNIESSFLESTVPVTKPALISLMHEPLTSARIRTTVQIDATRGGWRVPAFLLNHPLTERLRTNGKQAHQHLSLDALKETSGITLVLVGVSPTVRLVDTTYRTTIKGCSNATWVTSQELHLSIVSNEAEWKAGAHLDPTQSAELNYTGTVEHILRHFKTLLYFLQGCQDLYRSAALRRDIVIRTLIPTEIDIVWIPWALSEGHENSSTATLQPSAVHIQWVWCPEPRGSSITTTSDPTTHPASQISVDVSSSDVTMTITSGLLQPILIKSRSLYRDCLDTLNDCFALDSRDLLHQALRDHVSVWGLLRLIITTFELHASTSLVCQASTTPQWKRGHGARLGQEELVFNSDACIVPSGSSIAGSSHAVETGSCVIQELRLSIGYPALSKDTASTMETYFPPNCLFCWGTLRMADPHVGLTKAATDSLQNALARLTDALTLIPVQEMGISSAPALTGSNSQKIPPCVHGLPLVRQSSTSAPSGFYFYPGQLLSQGLLPLLDALIVWSNALTIVATGVRPRQPNDMQRALQLFPGSSRTMDSPFQGTKLDDQRKTQKGGAAKLSINVGSVRWSTPSSRTASASHPLPSDTLDTSAGHTLQTLEYVLDLLCLPSFGRPVGIHPFSIGFVFGVRCSDMSRNGVSELTDPDLPTVATCASLAELIPPFHHLRQRALWLAIAENNNTLSCLEKPDESYIENGAWRREWNLLIHTPLEGQLAYASQKTRYCYAVLDLIAGGSSTQTRKEARSGLMVAFRQQTRYKDLQAMLDEEDPLLSEPLKLWKRLSMDPESMKNNKASEKTGSFPRSPSNSTTKGHASVAKGAFTGTSNCNPPPHNTLPQILRYVLQTTALDFFPSLLRLPHEDEAPETQPQDETFSGASFMPADQTADVALSYDTQTPIRQKELPAGLEEPKTGSLFDSAHPDEASEHPNNSINVSENPLKPNATTTTCNLLLPIHTNGRKRQRKRFSDQLPVKRMCQEQSVVEELPIAEDDAITSLRFSELPGTAFFILKKKWSCLHWVPPLCRRTALRADGQHICLFFKCLLDLKCVAATPQLSALTRYVRTFCHDPGFGKSCALLFYLLYNASHVSLSLPSFSDDIVALLNFSMMTLDAHSEYARAVLKNKSSSMSRPSTETPGKAAHPTRPSLPLVLVYCYQIRRQLRSPHPTTHHAIGEFVLDVCVTLWESLFTLWRLDGDSEIPETVLLDSSTASHNFSKTSECTALTALRHTAPASFLLTFPLQSAQPILVNGAVDLCQAVSAIERMSTTEKYPTASTPPYPLSFTRPFVKDLTRLLAPFTHRLLALKNILKHYRPSGSPDASTVTQRLQ